MTITVNKTALLKNLQVLIGVIQSNNTLPVLDNFLFEIEANILKITASDLETTMSTTMEVEAEGNINIALQARMLIDILKSLPEQPLTFDVKDNNTVELISNTGNYFVTYAEAKLFPKPIVLDNPSTAVIPSKVLTSAITKTIFATGNDELRPIMNGVYFQLSNQGLTFVATDAHKLVKYTRNDVTANQEATFIMPKKPLNVLKGVLGTVTNDVTIEFNEVNASFTFDNFKMVCRLIDGKYPNYEAVIPKQNPNKLVLNKSQFLNSVNCVSVFSSKETHQVRLKIANGNLNITAEDVDYSNKAEERISCSYEGSDIYIGFNSRFLSEMLKTLDSIEVQMELSEPNRAGLLTPVDNLEEGENVLMLIMPSLIVK